MNINPIIIVGGEPNSIFFEIYFKTIKKIKNKSPIILIGSKKILEKQMKKLKYSFTINSINPDNLKKNKILLENINLINVNFNQKSALARLLKNLIII